MMCDGDVEVRSAWYDWPSVEGAHNMVLVTVPDLAVARELVDAVNMQVGDTQDEAALLESSQTHYGTCWKCSYSTSLEVNESKASTCLPCNGAMVVDRGVPAILESYETRLVDFPVRHHVQGRQQTGLSLYRRHVFLCALLAACDLLMAGPPGPFAAFSCGPSKTNKFAFDLHVL